MARYAVTVVGLGKVGLPLACHLAGLGHKVRGYDTNQDLVHVLQKGNNPLPWEPGVDPVAIAVFADLDQALADADLALVCVPTPLVGTRLSSELVRQAVSEIELRSTALIVILSTLDPRDTAVCGPHMVYNPPLIRLGHVREDLENMKLLLLGGEKELCQQVAELWFPGWRVADSPMPYLVHLFQRSPKEIAMAKLAINASLSARIAWANDLALTCREQGVDLQQVLDIVTADPRIGAAYMRAGAPPGGPCLPRDMEVWSSLVDRAYQPGPTMADAVISNHTWQMEAMVVQITADLLAMQPNPIRVAILGATYVPNAMDTTNSLGVALANALGSQFRVWLADPAMGHLGDKFPCRTTADAQKAVDWANAVVICTPWPEFEKLDFRGKPVIYGR